MAEKFGKLFADLLTLSSIDGTTSNMVGFLRRFGRSPDSLTSGLPIKVERFFSIAALSFVCPKVTPPPFHIGERIDACLARPVPFCFQGFLPPPLTSPLPLA